MNLPDTPEELLRHIKSMDHRERIVFEIPKKNRPKAGQNAYCVEIYVTFPFDNYKLSGGDQNRVLFQITSVNGKNKKGMSKTSCKRSDLNVTNGSLKCVWNLLST